MILSLRTLSICVLGAMLWPIFYALWMSFTPGEFLQPPAGEWSLRWYRTFFAQSQWTDALWHSLIVGAMASAISMVCGISAGVAVVKFRFRARRWFQAAVLVPLFIPALVLGLALLPAMRSSGLWGTQFSVAAAHSLWGMPLVFLAVRNALEDVDPNIELAARGLGARPVQVFLLVTLPVILPAALVGALMAFIVSLNELVMALFLCTPAIETLPKVIWPNLRYTLSPQVAAASAVGMVATVALLVAVWSLVRRR